MAKVEVSDMQSFVEMLTKKFGSDEKEVCRRVFDFSFGRKWIKVSVRYARESSGSVYAFIDAANGNIYLPASWRAPAKHVRGNIFSNISCCGKFGVAYMR